MLQENYLSSFYIHTEKKISSYTLPTSQNDDKQIAWNTFDKSLPIFKEISELEIKNKETTILVNTNIVSEIANQTKILQLKKAGIWTFAAEAGGQMYYDTDFDLPCALVLGSEGNGVSKLVKDTCDFTVSIPMYGKVNSLNVSTAAAVLLYAIAHGQRK